VEYLAAFNKNLPMVKITDQNFNDFQHDKLEECLALAGLYCLVWVRPRVCPTVEHYIWVSSGLA
jgi:hypothetical protein